MLCSAGSKDKFILTLCLTIMLHPAFPILCLVLVTSFAARADDLADLIKRVPGEMNTVAVINVREINKSPRAVREKWKEHQEAEYLAGALAVPSWVTVVVIGAEIHPGDLSGGRSIELIPVENSASSTTIAKRENGVVQTVDDLTLVLSPKRGYFGFPAAGIVGVSSTMARQEFARWVRGARKPDKPAISQYLQDAVAANKDSHVIVAIDLKDCLDPTAVRSAIQLSGVVPKESEVDSLVNIFNGTRGLVFTCKIEEKTKAELRFEFGIPMADFLPAMLRLWPKALAAAGLDIDELKTATPKAEGKSVVFTTELSDTALRRMLSIVSAPGGDSLDSETSPKLSSPKEAANLSASLRYYKAVNSALDDLKAQGDAKGKNYSRSAIFFDNYAARIEKLSILEVDPLLVQYGNSVASKLRAMAGSLKGLQVQLDAYDHYKVTTSVSSGGGGGYIGRRGFGVGGGGSVAMSTNVQELSTKQAELVAKLEPERAKIWGVLESDRSSIRKEMLDKYKIDFEQYKR